MKDMIYRQAAIDELKACRDIFCDNTPYTFSELPYGEKCRVDEIDNAIAILVNLPSAQPEIIRCGECRWFQCNMRMDGYLPKGVSEFECRHWCGSCDPVDFCSHAERKTDE